MFKMGNIGHEVNESKKAFYFFENTSLAIGFSSIFMFSVFVENEG